MTETNRPVGRPPTPISDRAKERIIEWRLKGTRFRDIAAALAEEFGLKFSVTRVYEIWLMLEPLTSDGAWIERQRKIHGLPRRFWRKFLAADRRREARERGRSASPNSAASPARVPPAAAAPNPPVLTPAATHEGI